MTEKQIKKREKFDEYEMLDEYDFSANVRGRFHKPKKQYKGMTILPLTDNKLIF